MNNVQLVFGIILAVIIVILGFYFYSKSKGKILINLEKFNYAPGETIKGEVKLIMKKPSEAKSLKVGLVGLMNQKTTQFSKNGVSSNSRTREVFSFYQNLDGEKLYNQGEKSYNFEIKIPQDVISKKPEGVMGSIVDTVSLISGSRNMIEWYITTSLDTAGFNIKNEVQVNIA